MYPSSLGLPLAFTHQTAVLIDLPVRSQEQGIQWALFQSLPVGVQSEALTTQTPNSTSASSSNKGLTRSLPLSGAPGNSLSREYFEQQGLSLSHLKVCNLFTLLKHIQSWTCLNGKL